MNPTYSSLRKSLESFSVLYSQRPIKENRGGMGFNHSFALWWILKRLQPNLVIESGVWKGHSTWIIEKAVPDSQIMSFDISFANLTYKSTNACYFKNDFRFHNWNEHNLQNSVIFFDDHQNTYQRILQAYFLGFRKILFEDNYPVGEGDFYSLKHLQAGTGTYSSQMSRRFQGSRRDILRRKVWDLVLSKLGEQQQTIVPPQKNDWNNLSNKIKLQYEFPPVWLENKSVWGTNYKGKYVAKDPILTERPIELADYSYNYFTYLQFY